MADKLGLSNEIKEIKLGKSFMKGDHPSFHTFRYDFMPASLDTTKRATVDIGEGHQVTVTVPHIEGSGNANTVFKGSKKPYQKECVLIIDHSTGEITLEKLSYNVQLKKTRAEGSSKIRSNTPVDTNFNKKSPVHKLSPQQKSQAIFGRSSPVQKCSPLPKSPVNNHASPNNSVTVSMPSLSTLSSKSHDSSVTAATIQVSIPVENDEPDIGVLSSSSSSDSSSSEDSSDSSSSDNEELAASLLSQTGLAGEPDEKPSKKEPSSMPSKESVSMPSKESVSMPSKESVSMPTVNSLPSMPKFSLLSEDLQLSESDSESDG